MFSHSRGTPSTSRSSNKLDVQHFTEAISEGPQGKDAPSPTTNDLNIYHTGSEENGEHQRGGTKSGGSRPGRNLQTTTVTGINSNS